MFVAIGPEQARKNRYRNGLSRRPQRLVANAKTFAETKPLLA